jgi:hypothetical protein
MRYPSGYAWHKGDKTVTTNLVFDVIHDRLGAGYTDVEARIDAGGKQFLAVSVAPDATNTNITRVELYVAPAGQPYPQAPDYILTTQGGPSDKIDAVGLERSGSDLIVYAATHAPGAGNRALHIVAKKLVGVFNTNPQFEAESNGAGAEVIPMGQGGGGGDVDYTRVENIVSFVVQRELTGLIQQFGGQGIRQGIEDKVKDGSIELLTGTDARSEAYKAALYDFLKNAAAGPLANVLGGGDAWGQARQEELRQIIREETGAALEEDILAEEVVEP